MASGDQVQLEIEAADGRAREAVARSVPVVIGRDPVCDVVLDDVLVSRRHAEIDVDLNGRLIVRDLGSSNGTFVDGVRLTGPVRLTPGGSFRVGRTIIRLAPAATSAATVVTAAPAAMPVPSAAEPVPAGTPPAVIPEPVVAAPPRPVVAAEPGPSGGSSRRPTMLLAAGGVAAVIVLLAGTALAAGWIGGRSGSGASSNAGVAVSSATSTMPAMSDMTPSMAASEIASIAPADSRTELKFTIGIGTISFTSDTKVEPSVCMRTAGPASLDVDVTSGIDGSTKFALTIPDTMGGAPVASTAEMRFGATGLPRAFVAAAKDITSLAVQDQGQVVVVTLSVKNAKGDTLSGTVTCNGVGG